MNKIRYDPAAATVIYKTKLVEGPNRNFEIFDPLDLLAKATAHIPNRGEHLVRYYGFDSPPGSSSKSSLHTGPIFFLETIQSDGGGPADRRVVQVFLNKFTVVITPAYVSEDD